MRKTWILSLLASLALAGCGIVYHAPVYQGNLLESKNVELVKEGMTKQDVLALIGTPSVADPFHTQRWDYVETMQDRRAQGKPDIKTLTLVFDGNNLASMTGSYFPEQDQQLAKKMGRFGNLPKDKKKKPAAATAASSSDSGSGSAVEVRSGSGLRARRRACLGSATSGRSSSSRSPSHNTVSEWIGLPKIA